jgi:uncharacterized nucleotidyltransferase DUF6036
MKDLTQTLLDCVGLFEKLGVPYAVMGGIAVRVYGIPRPRYDIDFTLAIDRDRLPQLYASVHELGYTVPEEYVGGCVDQVAGMPLVKFRLYVEGRGIDIDVFLAESHFQEQLLVRRRRAPIDAASIWFVSPEDLILLKVLAGRPRDLADVGDILFTQGQLDQGYMRHWAQDLGILDQLESVLAEPPPV